MSLHYERKEAKVGFGKEKEVKYVGRRRLADPFTLERLAKEISHITGLQQATAEIVLRYMVQEMSIKLITDEDDGTTYTEEDSSEDER